MRLSFSEQPQASLSEIRVLGPGGESVQRGSAKAPPGDPLALVVPVRRLPRGVYAVSWKVVSAVDGHATEGTYAFGVRQSPGGAAASASSTASSISALELVARWLFLLGVAALLGGAVAALAGFGGSSGSDLRLAAAGWAAALVGLLLLGAAQRSSAASSLAALLDTPVGAALAWRGAALALAGVGLLLARRRDGAGRRVALGLVAIAALGAIVAHVDAGHAAAGNWSSLVTVLAQVTHFAAAAIWAGGLAALLLGIRGEPSPVKAAAVRRFAAVALVALLAVFLTGTLRAVDELSSWGQLLSSGYGRAVLAKFALLGLILALANRNRTRGVSAAGTDLRPLRRTSRIELALAVAALAVAALLGTLAPPVPGAVAPPGITVAGSDFATTTRVELGTASAEPGPNLFTLKVEDYDSGEPLSDGRASLRFTPVDDPGVAASTLELKPGPDGTYVGSGANLAFDGRWAVTVTLQRGASGVTVPLQLEVPGPRQFVSALRIPGKPPQYTMQIGSVGDIRIEPDPQRAGPSTVHVTCFTAFGSFSEVDQIVVTAGSAGEWPRRQSLRRLGPGRFVSEITLEPGRFEIGVVAHTRDGTRLRGVFQLGVPGG